MSNRHFHWSLALILTVAPTLLMAADPASNSKELASRAVEMEMFSAMAKGDIDVTFIAKDSTKATVIFKNKTDKPVSIRLPEAFAGMPVLAQPGLGLGLGGPFGGPAAGSRGGRQSVGGSFPGAGGPGFGIMNVAPDATRKIRVKTVCLEYGKDDPSSRIKYAIRPLDSFTDKADIRKLCKLLGRGEISQFTAQAAAWHLMDGMSWQRLAQLDRVKIRSYREKWFTTGEIAFAKKTVELLSQAPSPATPRFDSLSQQN